MSEQYRTLVFFMRDNGRGALFSYGLQERGKKNTTRSAVVVATRRLHSLTSSADSPGTRTTLLNWTRESERTRRDSALRDRRGRRKWTRLGSLLG